VTEGQLFGTDQKQTIGATWPVNKQAFVQWSKSYTPAIAPEAVSGAGKLVAAPKEGEVYFLDFEGAATVDLGTVLAKDNPAGKPTGKAQFTWTARYPADYSTGPLRQALKVEINIHENSTPKQPDTTQDLAIVYHFTQEVTYLPPAKAPESPNPGRAGVVLDAAKVKRSPVSNEVQWTFYYSLPRDGSQKDKTWYCAVEFKGQAAPNDWVELGKRETAHMEVEGQWSGQLKLAEAPAGGYGVHPVRLRRAAGGNRTAPPGVPDSRCSRVGHQRAGFARFAPRV